MLKPGDINKLHMYADELDIFYSVVEEVEEDNPFFEIDDFEEEINICGYEATLNRVNDIIIRLTEIQNKELLGKMIWLKRVLLKKWKQSVVTLFFLKYRPNEILDHIEEIFRELSFSTYLHLYVYDKEYTEEYETFYLDYENYCNGLTIDEISAIKKQKMCAKLLKMVDEKFERENIQRIEIIKSAIKCYESIMNSCLIQVKKQKQLEYREQLRRQKAIERIFPDNIEGQEVLECTRDLLDERIETILNEPKEKPKPKVLELTYESEYEQLSLFSLYKN